MKAVILAGGAGTRLAPYTTVFPKPLVPVGHRPIIEIIVRQLVRHGFTDITMNVGYLAELIQAYFAGASNRINGAKLSYEVETTPTGTAGSIRSAMGAREPFLVMNGDVLTSLDYSKLIEFHQSRDSILTVAMYRRDTKIDFGVIEMNEKGEIVDYIEKPSKSFEVSMGVYVYEPRALDYIEPDTYLDFPDLVLRLLESGEKVVGYPFDGYWLDIGRHDDYAKAQSDFETHRDILLPDE